MHCHLPFRRLIGRSRSLEGSDDEGAGAGHVSVVIGRREYIYTIGGLTGVGGTSTTVPK